jgi:hypothetical protein
MTGRAVGTRGIALAVALGAWFSSASFLRADLHFAADQVEIGKVKRGAPLAHEFTFTNEGPENVAITEVRVSCGCLRPRLEQRTYRPGEGGTLRIEVNTLTQAAGPHAWRADIRYRKGSEECDTAVVLSGTVVAEITVEPPELVIFAEHAISHELRVTDQRPKPLTLTKMETTSPAIKAQLTGESRDTQGRATRTIRLDVAENFPEGRFQETLHIKTDDPLYRDLQVPVTVVKRSQQRVTAMPASVELMVPRGQAIPSRIVRLSAKDAKAVEIDRIIPSDSSIRCTWARGPGTQATLRIAIDRTQVQADGIRGTIEIQVSQPTPETLILPIHLVLE